MVLGQYELGQCWVAVVMLGTVQMMWRPSCHWMSHDCKHYLLQKQWDSGGYVFSQVKLVVKQGSFTAKASMGCLSMVTQGLSMRNDICLHITQWCRGGQH